MREVEVAGRIFDADITARASVFEGGGLHVSVWGGTSPHIGAVSIVSPDGQWETKQFPGHRDGVVSEKWAAALKCAGFVPVIVEAGIHYDSLSPQDIDTVVALTDALLEELLKRI